MRVFIFLISLIPLFLFAKDLGRFGAVFSILEKDMEDEIHEKLQAAKKDGRLQAFQDSLKKDLKERVTSPRPVSFLKAVQKEREFKVDPSMILDSDIKVPKDDGSFMYLGRKGDLINPLDYSSFDTPLLFLDGDSQSQRDYAKELVLKNPNTKCLLVKGTPGYDKERKIFFYFDQRGIYSKRFSIQAFPSHVTGKANEKLITIHEIFLEEPEA